MKKLSFAFVALTFVALVFALSPAPALAITPPTNGKLLTQRLVYATKHGRGQQLWATYTPAQQLAVQKFLHTAKVRKHSITRNYVRPSDAVPCTAHDVYVQGFNTAGWYLWVLQQHTIFCYDGAHIQYTTWWTAGTTYQMFWAYWGIQEERTSSAPDGSWALLFDQTKFRLCFWGFCPDEANPWAWQEGWGNGNWQYGSGY